MVEDSETPRLDYFDDRRDDDAPRRPLPRAYRRKARADRGAAPDPGRFTSGLESAEMDPAADARVRRVVRFFTESREGRDSFVAALERSGKYEQIITRALDDHRLPRALIAAALVESGFSPTVVSPAGAAGLWQFMSGTAKVYGLRIERGYDERLSPWRSSQAAAEHLADLYEQLQSWELALAAYNMGYNGLVSRLTAHKAKTFWELSDIDGGLPAETALYVPRVLAAALVMANLDAFGFDTVERDAPILASEVEVPPGIPVHLIARAAGMPVRAFRELNSELVGTAAPREGDPVLVHVPTPIVDRTRATLARLDRGEIDPDDLERPREERTAWSPSRAGDLRRHGRERDARDDVRPWDRDRDRDRGWDRRYDRAWDGDDARYGYARAANDWRSARDGRNARALGSHGLRDDDDLPAPRYNPPPYARDSAYGSRDDDREDYRLAPRPRRPDTSTVFYRTVDGDTAGSIGKTFGLPADEVCTQNGLKLGDAIDKGTLLRLRVSAKTLDKLSPSHDG